MGILSDAIARGALRWPRPSVDVDEVWTDTPDDAAPYRDAYEWKRVTPRIVEAEA